MRWVPLLPWLLLVSAAAGCGGGGKTGGHDAGADVETADLQPDLSDHVVFPDFEVADIEADPDLV